MPILSDRREPVNETHGRQPGSIASIAPGGRRAARYDAALAEAHAHVASLTPTAAAELLLCLTIDVRRLDAASLARVRLAAVRLAREIQAVAA